MPFCPDCGGEISEETRFCTNCGKDLTKTPTLKKQERRVPPAITRELSDFEIELIWQVYLGSSKVPDLVPRLRVRYDTLIRSVNELVDKELVETSTYREGLFGEYVSLHLTPKGYNIAASLAKVRQPVIPQPLVVSAPPQQPPPAPPPTVQAGAGGPGVQQQVTVRSGWEVCGYACILLIIVLVVLLIVARGWVCQTFTFIPC